MGAALSRVLRLAGGVLSLAALLALGLLPAPREASATTFNPQLTVSLSNPAPGETTDLQFNFSIDSPDANFQTLVTFIPADFFMAPEADVADGAMVGHLDATSTLGLLNGQCNTNLPVTFELMSASTDIEDTLPLYYGYHDADGNGLPENADRYPDFLLRIAPDIKPRERLYGQTLVAGTQTFLNFVVFEPGAAIPRLPALDPALGYPTMVFLNDPTYPSAPIPVTDFCTPLDTLTTMFGTSRDNPQTAANESGTTLRRNPTLAGEYNSISFVRSIWDSDDDGIENSLDPCALTFNPGWDPRSGGYLGDSDGDGLPNVCDPSLQAIPDQDGDGYMNRQDNCPLVAGYYPLDTDQDLVGDDCDPAPHDPSNGGTAHRHEVCVRDTFVVGSGPPAPDVPCPEGADLPVPLVLEAYPDTAVRTTGETQYFVFNVREPGAYDSIPGIMIDIDVSGANPMTQTCVTDDQGYCEWEYVGVNPGTDIITLSASAEGQHVVAVSTVRWLLPPANDDFASAQAISEIPFTTTGDYAAAGREELEPWFCQTTGRTTWYALTSPEDRFVMVEAEGLVDGTFMELAVYDGASVNSLDAVACGYPYYEPFDPEVEFPVFSQESYVYVHLEAGETVYLQVSGSGYNEEDDIGGFELSIEDAVDGDVDCDGDADEVDILTVLITLNDDWPPPCYGLADWDCDGWLGPADITSGLARLIGSGPALADCPWQYDYGDYSAAASAFSTLRHAAATDSR